MERRQRWLWTGACVFLAVLPDLLMPAFRAWTSAREPAALSRWVNDGPFAEVGFLGMDPDEAFYAARSAEASRHWFAFDPYIKGRRDWSLGLLDPLGHFFVGRLAALTGNFSAAWILAKALLAGVWFCYLTAFFERAGIPSKPTVLFSLTTVIFFDVLSGRAAPFPGTWWTSLPSRLLLTSTPYNFFLGATRLMRPAFTFAPFLVASWFFVRHAERPGPRSAAIASLAAVMVALDRPDLWEHFVAAMTLFLAAAAIRRKNWSWWLAAPWAAACLAGIGLIVVYVAMDRSIIAQKYRSVVGVSWSSLWLLAGLLWAFLGDWNEWVAWAGCVLAAAALCSQGQLILGNNLADYYWRETAIPFFWTLTATCRGKALLTRIKPRLWTALTVSLLAFSSWRGFRFAQLHYASRGLPRTYAEALDWLKKNTPEDSVIGTLSPEATVLIPIYAHNKMVAACGPLLASHVPPEENARRLDYLVHLFGVPLDRYLEAMFPSDPLRYDDVSYPPKESYRVRLEAERAYSRYALFENYPGEQVCPLLRQAARTPWAGPPPEYLWIGPTESQWIDPLAVAKRLGAVPVFRNGEVTVLKL